MTKCIVLCLQEYSYIKPCPDDYCLSHLQLEERVKGNGEAICLILTFTCLQMSLECS